MEIESEHQLSQTEFHKLTEPINYSEIDSGIRELVQKLNELPFVSTIGSCEGHLRNQAYDVLPEAGHSFIFNGDLIFFADKTNPKTSTLKEKINQLIEKYPFVSIHEHHCDEEDCSIEGAQCIDLDYSDLTHIEDIADTDSLENMVLKRHQVPTETGQERIEAFHQFWSDFNNTITELSENTR